ncbi:hypothetical protein NM688_g2542 [Phlebia brevispora]|uniref:Uncharacterized protein n=1 Tax=Phlebia brevispora TaxID=194682 RepID=A0ACC1T888_9APHY|nr:hypothetical protein NM688_g2542 [Phlebia brevispora]
MAASTVCREDQHPQCTISFFASESLTAPPRLVRVLAPLTAVIIPYCIHSVLGISQLNEGPSTLFLRWLMPAALTQACAAWTLEWIEVADITPARTAWLRPLRTLLSSGAFGMVLMMSYTLRQTSPSGPKIGTSWNAGEGRGKRVLSRSTPNALAAPYFLLWCIPFCTVYVVNQLSAQVVLGVSAIALIAYVELLVGMRTARGLHSPLDSSVPSSALLPDMPRDVYSPIVFSDIIPLALLAQHTFYATGHQVTISSVQWKTAFVLTPTLNLLISPVTLVINECSPWFLAAFAVPLVALWKRCPTSNAAATGAIRRECIRAAIGMMFYHNILLLSSAATSFWLRQHPMAWKVFVPRLIVAALTVVVVDVALLLGVQLAIMQLPDRAPRGFVPSSKNNS